VTDEGGSTPVARRGTDVTAVDVDGRLSLFVPSSEQIVLLNESASAIWTLCDGTRTVDAIVSTLAEEWAKAPDVMRVEVHQVLARLDAVGALVPAPDR
jgi:hypothetical protein